MYYWSDFSPLENLWLETKTGGEQARVETAHLLSAKTLVSHRTAWLQRRKLFASQNRKVKEEGFFCFSGSLWCFWNFLALLICRARKFVDRSCSYNRRMLKKIGLFEKFCGGPFWCFWSFLVQEEQWVTGVSQFLMKSLLSQRCKTFVEELLYVSEDFWYRNISCIRDGYHFSSKFSRLTVTKYFVEGTFWCLRVLCKRGACAWHILYCTCRLQSNIPGKSIRKRRGAFVVILKMFLIMTEKIGRKHLQKSAFCFIKHDKKINGKLFFW